jgi:hypothetical protein
MGKESFPLIRHKQEESHRGVDEGRVTKQPMSAQEVGAAPCQRCPGNFRCNSAGSVR